MKFPECYELWGSNGRKVLAAEKIRKEWEEPYNPKAQASLQKRLEKNRC